MKNNGNAMYSEISKAKISTADKPNRDLTQLASSENSIQENPSRNKLMPVATMLNNNEDEEVEQNIINN